MMMSLDVDLAQVKKKDTAEEYPVPELNYQSLESFVILETQQELGGRQSFIKNKEWME